MLRRITSGLFSLDAYLVRHVALLILAFALSPFLAQAQAPKDISNDSGDSQAPQIALDSRGNINVVWMDNTPGNYDIFFARSTDRGSTFSTPKNISNTPGYSEIPEIAVDSSGNINVVWWDNTPGYVDIFFSRSTDGGSTFSAPMNISNGMTLNSVSAQLAVDSTGNINVVWETDGNLVNQAIIFTRSTDGGTSFSTPKSISNGVNQSNIPQMAVDSSANINVVWWASVPTGQSDDTYFTRSTDGGSTFSSPVNVSKNNISQALFPEIAVDLNGNINVVWYEQLMGQYQVYFSRSTDGGSTFSTPLNISNDTGDASLPVITVDSSGDIGVVWIDTTPGNFDIFFSRSTDGGSTFSVPKNISNNPGFSGNPQIVVDSNGNINIIWGDETPGNRDIFFSESSDGGSTFSTPENISNDPGNSYLPEIALDSDNNIDVVWYDNTPGNNSIFFDKIAPAVTLSTRSLSFGNQNLGTTSPPQTVTLTNTGTRPLTIFSIAANGDFGQYNNCGTVLAAAGMCTINVTFTPATTGMRGGAVTITDNAADSPQIVSLSGVGTYANIKFSSGTLIFHGQRLGTTSPPHIETLSNPGPGVLVIYGISISGDYAQTNNCVGQIPAMKTCQISITFTPTGYGTRKGAVVITDNARRSPQTVTLFGTGPDFSISASPTSLTVTRGSKGTSTLTLTPENGFNQTIALTCTGAPKNSSCAISPSSVTLDGTNAQTATLTITTTINTPTGKFTLTTKGAFGTLTHTAKVSLMVQ
jgi:hypothetical protein